MEHSLNERRAYSRFGHPIIAHLNAVLRPGRLVWLADLSTGGASIEGRRPLRPGSRVYLHLSTDHYCAGRSAHILRCAVASIAGADGVRYRGALKFDYDWEELWEEFTRDGYAVPALEETQASTGGHVLLP